MAKIIGNTTATPNPRPDWNQTDSTKADYIKNKPIILTEEDVVELVTKNGGGSGVVVDQIQSDWNQTDETKADYIKNKPTLAIVAISGSYNDLTDKPTYTAEDVGALPADTVILTNEDIKTEVETALIEAKASGEFKGEKGDPYELTEADKTAIKDAVIGETKQVFYCDDWVNDTFYDRGFDKTKIYPQNIDIDLGDYIINDGAVYEIKSESKTYWKADKVVDISPIPEVTETDDGKFLRVVNGAWSAVTIENAEGVSF